jgi:hypothetical protein
LGLPEEQRASRADLAAAQGSAVEDLRAALDSPSLWEDPARSGVVNLVGEAVRTAVLQVRSDARAASRAGLLREYAAAGGDAGDLSEANGSAEDEAAADAVAASFRDAFRANLSAALDANGRLAAGVDPRAALRRALGLAVEERADRIARTECSRAFNAERAASLLALGRAVRARGGEVPRKTWVCVDGGDCLVCFALCGTDLPVDEPWTTGARPFVEEVTPGAAHPNCACFLAIHSVPGAAPARKSVRWPADFGRPRTTGEARLRKHLGF